MANNSFGKEVDNFFDMQAAAFQARLEVLKSVRVFKGPTAEQAERTSNGPSVRGLAWRPIKYRGRAVDISANPNGDQSALLTGKTQLSVPIQIDKRFTDLFTLTDTELRDQQQDYRLRDATGIALADAFNLNLINRIASNAALTVKITASPTGVADVSQIDALFDELGVPSSDAMDRILALNSRDYVAMAANLGIRQYMDPNVTAAFRRLFLGEVGNMTIMKNSQYATPLLPATATNVTVDTTANGPNNFVPVATLNGIPVDNRMQTLTVNSTTNIKQGDRFSIAGVNNVHRIGRNDTGTPATFFVDAVLSSTTLRIGYVMITNQGSTANNATAEYQSVIVNTPSATSAITFLNTAKVSPNLFWARDAVEVWPGNLALTNGAGIEVIQTKLGDTGFMMQCSRQGSLMTSSMNYRFDVPFGCNVTVPDQCGVMLFNQV